jgi:hypothetical protein
VRPLRLTAPRADVDVRRRDGVRVPAAALVAARLRRLLLRDGHGAAASLADEEGSRDDPVLDPVCRLVWIEDAVVDTSSGCSTT